MTIGRLGPWGALAALVVATWAAGVGVGFAHPTDTVPGAAGYLVPVLMCTLLMAGSLRRIPAARRGPWLWLAAALAMYLVGEALFIVLDLLGNTTWPTPADAVYLAAYVPVTVGLLGLRRQRGAGSNRGGLLDAVIVALSAATLFGAFVVLPIAEDSSVSVLGRVVSSAYPIADVLWIFLLARMLTGPGRSRSTRLLAWGTAATVAADVGNNLVQLLHGGDTSSPWLNGLWLAFYVGIALAAHVAAGERPAEPGTSAREGLTGPRLVLLGVAAVLPSLVLLGLALAGRPVPAAWLAAGSVLLMALVVTRIWDLLQQVRRQAGQLAALARTDALTGAANRRTWDHELDRACAAAGRDGIGLYVAILDLDHFKRYNDTHGHQAGDELLKAATAAWSDALDGGGFIARWGGEEFAVLLHALTDADALARFDRLRLVVPREQTCSIGAARWDATEPPAALLRRADEALYRAKAAGRNRLAAAPEVADAPGPAAVTARAG